MGWDDAITLQKYLNNTTQHNLFNRKLASMSDGVLFILLFGYWVGVIFLCSFEHMVRFGLVGKGRFGVIGSFFC